MLAIHAVTFFLRYGFASGSSLVVYLPFVVFPLMTLHGPLVEYFVRRSLFSEALRGPRRLPFLLGPPVFLVIFTLLFAAIPEFRDRDAILAQARPVAVFSGAVFLIFSLYHLIFWLSAVKALGTYRERFQASFSNLDNLRLQFLGTFTGLVGLAYLAHAALALLSLFSTWRFPVTPLESLLLLVMTYLVLYYLVRRPQIFTLPPESPEPPHAPAIADPAPEVDREPARETPPSVAVPASAASNGRRKYARQSLDVDTRRAHLERIQAFMDTERPYLDGELALADLAAAVEIPKHHLSMAINIELEMNFFQFVNAYRVDEARRLLADPSLVDENLLSIAYRAGFQSKAAFNKVFKKSTGQTPGQFRTAVVPKS
ncbi:MAG: helix-turn-helix domain-containing protein [Pseudomonadota bacterium]